MYALSSSTIIFLIKLIALSLIGPYSPLTITLNSCLMLSSDKWGWDLVNKSNILQTTVYS